jgi:hypothetical protein
MEPVKFVNSPISVRRPQCAECGARCNSAVHMGCDYPHCSEKCRIKLLIRIRKKDPNMENPHLWDVREQEVRPMARTVSLATIREGNEDLIEDPKYHGQPSFTPSNNPSSAKATIVTMLLAVVALVCFAFL